MTDATLKQSTIDRAAILRPAIVIDKGVAAIPKELYEQNLPDGTTLDTVKKIQQNAVDFTTGFDKAFGEAAIEHMGANPDVTVVTATVPMGTHTYNVAVERKRNVSAGPGAGRKDVHGYLTASLQIPGTTEKSNVQRHLQRQAAEILGG